MVAYQNPDGPPNVGYAGDDYPFIEQAQSLPTYGILWADPNQRDIHIGLTGDIEGAIEALKDGIPRGITVYFYLVPHSKAEICAIRDRIMDDLVELRKHGIELTGGGCGNKQMTVALYISPLLPEVIAYMSERYPGPLSFVQGGRFPLRPIDPPVVDHVRMIAIGSADAGRLQTCGRRPFPASALNGTGGAEDGVGPEYDALREAIQIYSGLLPDIAAANWQLAEEDAYGATFLTKRGDSWLEAPVFASTNEWVPGVIDTCAPAALDISSGNAEWWLDPAYPAPGSTSTEVHVLVRETSCAGARSPEGWILPPVVAYDAQAVSLAISIRGPGGAATCPMNPSFPVTVILPEPLGDRVLEGANPPDH